MAWNNVDVFDEEHELIITQDEIEEAKTIGNSGQFIIQKACEKANRLGKEKRRIKEVRYETVPGTKDYSIKYLCEYDPF